MSLEQYRRLFDQLVEAGTFFVILTGGEPFVRPDFMEIVEAARKRRLSVTIFTNGTLIADHHIQRLRELFVQEVHVSIYSADPGVHDSITRISGSFEKSVRTIRQLLTAGIRVRIKCPLMNVTAGGINGVKSLSRKFGIDVQFTTTITAQNDGSTKTCAFRLTPDQLRTVLTDPDVATQSTEPVRFHDNLGCIPCDTVFNGGAIDPTGNVFVCNQLQMIGGNVLLMPFGQIWRDSPVFNKLRQMKLGDLKQCAACDLFHHCTRCPGLAHLEDGDICGCSSAAKTAAEIREWAGIYPTETHIFSQP